MRSVFVVLMSILTAAGCARHEFKAPPDNAIAISYHFLRTPTVDAESEAAEYCSQRNSKPKLKSFNRGCMFFCGSQFHYYEYECVAIKLEDR
jgi:hypothetical protein